MGKKRQIGGWRLMAALAVAASLMPAQPAQAQDAAARCAALGGFNASPESSSRFALIPEAPTVIQSAELKPAHDGVPEHCALLGYVAPNIGFELRMPTNTWNGKFMMHGCGGYCGSLHTDRADVPLARNYAVVATDMGHQVKSWIFAYNNLQGDVDFGFRATHVVAVAAKVIVAEFYRKAPAKSYFMGCSTGGRQGMVEAQRFPKDFNGIISGSPVYDETGDGTLFLLWSARVNVGADGKPILDASQLPLIHDAVLSACDALDGLKDGILQDPRRCHFDPAQLQCKAGQDAAQCLSAEQIGVVRKIYSGATNSAGEKLYFGMPRGSEYNWTPDFIGANGKLGSHLGGPRAFANEFLAFMPFFYDPGFGDAASRFDYDTDPQRMGTAEFLFSASNPDLRKFKAAGGKMILYHGWDDNQIPGLASVDYYETATRTMGGEQPTKDFFRLFMLPSSLHCYGGPGGGEADWITALENWVERGAAPEQVTVYHMLNNAYLPRPRHPLAPDAYDRTRAVFAYPDVAKWSGKGDSTKSDSWVKAARTASQP